MPLISWGAPCLVCCGRPALHEIQSMNAIDNRLWAGIRDGRRAFCGPQIAWIDLTNRCNSSCICCWNYSPLLDSCRKADVWYRDELQPAIVFRLLDELKQMGTKEIFYSGGGDPLMYHALPEVIAKTSESGIAITLFTNFQPLDGKMLNYLERAPINRLIVNLWAASEEIYIRLHPGSRPESFTVAVERLRGLISSGSRPAGGEVILNNVLLKENVREFSAMAMLAYDLGANNVWYTTMDMADPAMRNLLLDRNDINWLLMQIERGRKDFSFDRRPGWHFSAAQLDELEKRLGNSRASEGVYHSDYIDNIPCYAGWTAVRITADGNVCPCCKADRMPLGNIHKNSFREIWHSKQYDIFRHNAKVLSKREPYFDSIRCWRVCDNWGYNAYYHSLLGRADAP
jgi:MoaA/NifB/PqqE/SkfB family radical SAM enzyme